MPAAPGTKTSSVGAENEVASLYRRGIASGRLVAIHRLEKKYGRAVCGKNPWRETLSRGGRTIHRSVSFFYTGNDTTNKRYMVPTKVSFSKEEPRHKDVERMVEANFHTYDTFANMKTKEWFNLYGLHNMTWRLRKTYEYGIDEDTCVSVYSLNPQSGRKMSVRGKRVCECPCHEPGDWCFSCRPTEREQMYEKDIQDFSLGPIVSLRQFMRCHRLQKNKNIKYVYCFEYDNGVSRPHAGGDDWKDVQTNTGVALNPSILSSKMYPQILPCYKDFQTMAEVVRPDTFRYD